MIVPTLGDDAHQVVGLRIVRRSGHRLRGLVLGFAEMPLRNKRPDMGGQRLHGSLFTHLPCLLSFLKRLYGITNRVGTL